MKEFDKNAVVKKEQEFYKNTEERLTLERIEKAEQERQEAERNRQIKEAERQAQEVKRQELERKRQEELRKNDRRKRQDQLRKNEKKKTSIAGRGTDLGTMAIESTLGILGMVKEGVVDIKHSIDKSSEIAEQKRRGQDVKQKMVKTSPAMAKYMAEDKARNEKVNEHLKENEKPHERQHGRSR